MLLDLRDLDAAKTVNKIRLYVGQYPDGNTTHELYFGSSPSPSRIVHTFSGYTTAGQWLEYNLPTPQTDVRYINITTTASPSYVSWGKIEVC